MTRPGYEPGYPYAVTVRDTSIPWGPQQAQHVRFDNPESAEVFADLMTGEPNVVTRWVLDRRTGEFTEVTWFVHQPDA